LATPTKPAVRDWWADGAVSSADIVDPGNTFVAAGWLQSTTPPARQYFNWLLNYLGNAVAYFMRRGVSDYDAAETYQIGDIVIGDAGMLMQSLTADQIGNLPSTSTANWSSLFNYATTGQMSNAIATALLPYSTTSQVNAVLASYATLATLSATLAGYVTNGALASTLSAYVTTGALGAALAPYATTASLSAYETVANFLATIAAYAPLNSPPLSGVPTTPTAAPGTNNAQIASCAFALAAASGTSVLSGNGWANLPGGLQLRWGSVAHTVDGDQAHNFTTPFSHGCFKVLAVVASSTAVEFFSVVGGSENASGWTQYSNNTTTINYWAIGF
jgi:hypothetical protein